MLGLRRVARIARRLREYSRGPWHRIAHGLSDNTVEDYIAPERGFVSTGLTLPVDLFSRATRLISCGSNSVDAPLSARQPPVYGCTLSARLPPKA